MRVFEIAESHFRRYVKKEEDMVIQVIVRPKDVSRDSGCEVASKFLVICAVGCYINKIGNTSEMIATDWFDTSTIRLAWA